MKKLAMFIVFMALGTIGLVAQDKDQDRDRDRIILVDGDVLQIRDRDQIRLQDKITLNDGTVVNADGTYIKDKDRVQAQDRLRDGSCLDMDGTLYANEYSYLQKINNENKTLTQAQIQERNQNRYYVMNIDGELYQIKNQAQDRLKQQLKLGNGVIVNPDGTYQNRDKKQLRLRDGECLNVDGKKFKNTYMQRKTVAQKNKKMMQKKVQKKPLTPVKKKNMKKGSGY